MADDVKGSITTSEAREEARQVLEGWLKDMPRYMGDAPKSQHYQQNVRVLETAIAALQPQATTSDPGRVEIGPDDPLYLRPSPECIAAIEKLDRGNNEARAAVRNMPLGSDASLPLEGVTEVLNSVEKGVEQLYQYDADVSGICDLADDMLSALGTVRQALSSISDKSGSKDNTS